MPVYNMSRDVITSALFPIASNTLTATVSTLSSLTPTSLGASATPTEEDLDPSRGAGAVLAQELSSMERQAVFWTAIAIAVLVNIVQGAITTLIEICEAERLWTIRFSLSLYEHLWWTGIAVTLVASLGSMVVSFLAGNTGESLGIILLSAASSLAVFRYAWPAWRNRHYCRNRWMAWTGPSRTGIDGRLVPFIGDMQYWRYLYDNIKMSEQHPVERQLTLLYRRRSEARLIPTDPTDLLRTAHSLYTAKEREKEKEPPSKESSTQPSSVSFSPSFPVPLRTAPKAREPGVRLEPNEVPDGLYHPVTCHEGQAASLLWGEKLGFLPRVSRGILSVPHRLLISNPRTETDHNGQALCLAHGILARNKGLAPATFILHLDMKKLEEKSVQWPRPSKVLRSYYRKEMESMYGTLGETYVKCATELALLLADTSPNIISDWLGAQLEHQDLELNRTISELGASDDDLQILYRLSYASMLVSLSSHALGHRVRPEMALFDAYVHRVEGRSALEPSWMCKPWLQIRLKDEWTGIDSRCDLNALIEAVLPPYRFDPSP